MPKVSVIVPIYGVERYIKRCVTSLMQQTLDDVEFVFVNDCTPDNSMAVLQSVIKEFPQREHQIKIINHDKNQGLAAARLSGIKEVSGEYIIHCDSDDWIDKHMYKMMFDKAKADNADIVVCDLIHEFNEKKEIEQSNPHIPHYEAINKLNIKYGWYLCNKLVKRSLIFENQIFPIIGLNMWEDVLVTNRLYYYAKRISYIDIPLYHYNHLNENSIVNSTSLLNKRKQQYQVVESLNDFFNEQGFDFSDAYLSYRITIKDKFLELSPPDYHSWRKFYPEIANLVLKDKSYSILYRVCYYFAQHGFVAPFKIIRKLSSLCNG